MNHMWSQRERDSMRYPVLDGSCTNPTISICTPALLHARHNMDVFSKYTFLKGNYTNYSMEDLDLTNVRDWAMYIALSSADQGQHGDIAWDNFINKTGGRPLREYCRHLPTTTKKTVSGPKMVLKQP